jgi:uncharacterized alkaline shock family protein YloU
VSEATYGMAGAATPAAASTEAIPVARGSLAIGDGQISVAEGVGIAELVRSIQRNVKQSVELMTGLQVVEVNVAVDDVCLPGTDEQETTRSGAS